MGSLVDILKYSGPISLPELIDRVSGEPDNLVTELKALEREGLIQINGPLTDLERAFKPNFEADTARTIVELSSRGLRHIMPA